MSEGRNYSELTEDDVKKLEEAYTSDPRSMKTICEELNIKYSAYVYIMNTVFPDVQRCKRPPKYSLAERLERAGLTKKDVLTIKCKYIKTNIPVKDIIKEFNLTQNDFKYIRKKFFPEWTRVSNGSGSTAVKDEKLTFCTDDEVLEVLAANSKEARLNASDKKWLRKHWNWVAAEKKSKKVTPRLHTRAVCSSGRRFG